MKTTFFSILFLCINIFGFAQVQQQGDITLFPNGNFDSHNDQYCYSMFFVNVDIQINNSYLNDTVKVIDGMGNVMNTYVNTIGQSFWTIPFHSSLEYVEDVHIFAGYVTVPIGINIYKIIADNDTLYVNNNQTYLSFDAPANACTYSNVSGKFYIDYDNDCVFSSGDVGVTGLLPTLNTNYLYQNGGNHSGSNNTGNYQLNFQQSWLIDYTVNIPSIYQFAFQPSPCFINGYTFTSLPQANVDFPLHCVDIDTYVHGWRSVARPALPFSLSPRVNNIGCTAVSGQLKLKLDPNVVYDPANSIYPADIVNGDTLIWNYANLNNLYNNTLYINQFLASVELTPTLAVNIGDTLVFELSTDVHPDDVNAGNNAMIIRVPIVNSYDPNIKEVSPKGEGSEGFIPATTEKLTYTIHFQNTGTADAINVVVIDTLESNVIPETLRLLGASHFMTPRWLNGNTIEFKFPNINLPDSATNEPLSHGFVSFEIDMVQGLAPGTEIKNKVEIYFDTNEPIVTDFAINTIEFPSDLSVEQSSLDAINVFPNPTDGVVTISIGNSTSGKLFIRDVAGKIMLENDFNNTNLIQTNTNGMASGMYIYELVENKTNQSISGKLIVK